MSTFQGGPVLGVTFRIVPVFQTVLVVVTVTQLIAWHQNAQTAFKVGWVQLVTIPACTATLKVVFACVIPASLEVDAKVSVPGLENASTTNVIAAKSQELLIWGNTVSCRDVQANVPALIMVFVTRLLRNVYALKDGPGMIVGRQTAQEHRSVLAMDVVAIQIQDGATVSRSGLVRCANYLA